MKEATEHNTPVVKDIREMTDREIAEETLQMLRTAAIAMAELQKKGIGGMMREMMSRG